MNFGNSLVPSIVLKFGVISDIYIMCMQTVEHMKYNLYTVLVISDIYTLLYLHMQVAIKRNTCYTLS